jgi:hypothetical protein
MTSMQKLWMGPALAKLGVVQSKTKVHSYSSFRSHIEIDSNSPSCKEESKRQASQSIESKIRSGKNLMSNPYLSRWA